MSASDVRSRRRRSPGEHKHSSATPSSSGNTVSDFPASLEGDAALGGLAASLPSSIGAYELLLRSDDGRDEVRFTDHLHLFAREPLTLEFRGQRWQIAAVEPSSQSGFIAKVVCRPVVTSSPPVALPVAIADDASDAVDRRPVLAASRL
jgi:hypothetical protein